MEQEFQFVTLVRVWDSEESQIIQEIYLEGSRDIATIKDQYQSYQEDGKTVKGKVRICIMPDWFFVLKDKELQK